MLELDFYVKPENEKDPMLIENLQDSDNDLEMTSISHDFVPQMDGNEFEQNVERWEDNPNFNIFDYIGDEEHDQGSSLTDDPKDQLYKNWQYNQVAFGGNADYNTFQSSYNHNMGRAPVSSSALNASHGSSGVNAYEPNNFYNDYGSTSSASLISAGSTPPKMGGMNAGQFMPVSVKREPAAYYESDEMGYLDDDYSSGRPSAAPSASIPIDPAVIEQRVNQVTKRPPRKYRMKPENEKVNPVYKMKRSKNNDAVRRSREKAKVIQQQKEARLITLEKDLRTLWDYHLKSMEYVKQQCRCGIALPKPPRLQSMDL